MLPLLNYWDFKGLSKPDGCSKRLCKKVRGDFSKLATHEVISSTIAWYDALGGSLALETGIKTFFGKPDARQLLRTMFGALLSGTESAILNRESSDSESCDSNRAIPRLLSALVGCDTDGDSESIFRDSTLLRFDSFFASHCRILCPDLMQSGYGVNFLV